MNKEKLFEAFPTVSDEEWKDKIISDLKGADFDRKLVWKTSEGFNVQPYYRAENLGKLPHMEILPGNFPFVRGNNIKNNSWLVRQDIKVKDIREANKKSLKVRLLGVDSLGFKLADDIVPNAENIEILCENIRADIMELNFQTSFPLETIKSLDYLAKKYNRDLDKVSGSIEYDPIGFYSRNGKFKTSEEDDFSLIKEMHNAAGHLANIQYLVVDATIFNNSAAGIVNELAFALSTASEYLTYLTNEGLNIDDIAPRIRFHFSVGSDYFMEIAKFRAAKYLWSKIVNSYGLSDASNAIMQIHCSNSLWNKTVYDPYVNMLRTTTESMSAVLGGVNSLSVLPFNAAYENETEFSDRIARNQQLVLKGESYLDRVADISAGSYYIEELTDKLIHNAWEQFLKIDDEGGYVSAFKKGIIQDIITNEASTRNFEIATRRKSLLGTNQYPNISEHLAADIVLQKKECKDGEGVEPLKIYRGAEKLEELRYNTDKYSKNNKRPVAWMFSYGNLAMRKARSQFAGNFFGCAGYEIVDNAGFGSIEEGINEALLQKPEIVVICSSDNEYAEIVEQIFSVLKEKAVVVLAGYPKDLIDRFNEIGLTNLIHIKSNLLEELKRYNNLLKIN
jgi:methylmalonyl-CoA mutase